MTDQNFFMSGYIIKILKSAIGYLLSYHCSRGYGYLTQLSLVGLGLGLIRINIVNNHEQSRLLRLLLTEPEYTQSSLHSSESMLYTLMWRNID